MFFLGNWRPIPPQKAQSSNPREWGSGCVPFLWLGNVKVRIKCMIHFGSWNVLTAINNLWQYQPLERVFHDIQTNHFWKSNENCNFIWNANQRAFSAAHLGTTTPAKATPAAGLLLPPSRSTTTLGGAYHQKTSSRPRSSSRLEAVV